VTSLSFLASGYSFQTGSYTLRRLAFAASISHYGGALTLAATSLWYQRRQQEQRIKISYHTREV
jgi:hypothetical protein